MSTSLERSTAPDVHYIGDGVYATFTDRGVELRKGSHDAAECIVLDDDTTHALMKQLAAHRGHRCGCAACERGACEVHR